MHIKRNLKTLFYLASLVGFISQVSDVAAQSMPTINILSRTFMVVSQYGQGTIFSIDVDHREYWITAKHILTGAEHSPFGSVADKPVTLKILKPGDHEPHLIPINFSIVDPNSDPKIDIVVLAHLEPLLPNQIQDVNLTSGGGGAILGGDCEFLGYPVSVGRTWNINLGHGKTHWMPFVKHCTVSAMTNDQTHIIILDGINNHGFSGGPVIYRTGPQQQIIGVISGFYPETIYVMNASTPEALVKEPKETVEENSGFFIAFGISYAIDAIHKNPIGPLRKAQ